MKLDANRLAVSFGITTAVLWVICSTAVALLPGSMMTMTGHMLHANVAGFSWTMTWIGFVIGLVSWTIWASLAGWLIGWCYNRLWP